MFIRNIDVHGLEHFPKKGAFLMAGTHPNSFLDASLMHLIQPRHVWSLARGDAFKGKLITWLLDLVKIIPIYRISEGKENLSKNDATFLRCQELFRKGEGVLIFSEGLCANQKKVLPLKKGTARLALESWQNGLDVPILPMAISYSKFHSWGQLVNVRFGKPFGKNEFDIQSNPANVIREFNERLQSDLSILLDQQFRKTGFLENPIYFLAYPFHFPFYYLIQKITARKFRGTVFIDSIHFFFLFFGLPIYWITLYFFLACLF